MKSIFCFFDSRNVAALAAFAVLFNCASAKLVPAEADFNPFVSVLADQSVVFQYFSFASLPLKIVNKLFEENAASREGKKSPAKKDPSQTSAFGDFSITVFNYKVSFDRLNFHSKPAGHGSIATFGIDPGPPDKTRWRALFNSSLPLGGLCLAVFFFLLPRSSTNENAVAMFYARI